MCRFVFASVISITAVFSIAVAHADDYYRQLERRQEQIDRDRVNFSWDSRSQSKFDYYSAIAYSPKTGKFGYSYSQPSQSAACNGALNYCSPSDAKIIGWVKNGYCALAESPDGIGFGYGDTAKEARQRALKDCPQNMGEAKIVICVYSGR